MHVQMYHHNLRLVKEMVEIPDEKSMLKSHHTYLYQ